MALPDIQVPSPMPTSSSIWDREVSRRTAIRLGLAAGASVFLGSLALNLQKNAPPNPEFNLTAEELSDKLDAFINIWDGRKNDFDGNGDPQCGDLINEWSRFLGKPQLMGASVYMFYGQYPSLFESRPGIPDTPLKKGSIVVKRTGKDGHVGIATGNGFELFGQNDPIGSAAHRKVYDNLNDAIGVMIPRLNPSAKETGRPIATAGNQEGQSPTDYKRFNSSFFSIDFPKNWSERMADGYQNFISPDGAGRNVVRIAGELANGYNAVQAAQAYHDGLGSILKDPTQIEPFQFPDGRPAYIFKGAWVSGSQTLWEEADYFFLENDQIWNLGYYAAPGNGDSMRSVLMRMEPTLQTRKQS